MEDFIRVIVLYSTNLITGLSAGLFYAWAVSVIPGTLKISDQAYLETMQSINRAILNPAFYLIFFGSLVLIFFSAFQYYQIGATTRFRLLLAAALCYAIGTFGVTVFGNVPLNESLDALQLGEFSLEEMASTRDGYEGKWNRFHYLRTVFSVLSFMLALLAAFINE